MLALLVVLSLLFAWALAADRLARWSITAPLAFAVAGIVLTRGYDPAVPLDLEAHSTYRGVELVLAVLLFVDATEAEQYEELEQRSVGEGRLLFLALPVSVVLATLAGAAVFPGTNWWLLGVTALVVMPMDLAPISMFLRDRRVPLRVRAALNIEGGFSDGLISPLFVFCIANLVRAHSSSFADLVVRAVKEAGLAVVVGIVLGYLASQLVRRALGAGWASAGTLRLASLVLPFMAYATSVLVGGNGFVAAFVTGLCYSAAAHAVGGNNLELVHDMAQLMAFAVWFTFGKLTADEFASGIGWGVVLYGLLALTVLRFVPVYFAVAGKGFDRPERCALGWLGSRGVTSIVFAVLAVTQLPPAEGRFVVNAMCATVLLSVVLHGVSVVPVARWFERRATAGTK
ncbi:cation:proton antiporter [Streptomyces subrutilus]|uniref:Sodium:proton exchanger n=1 Tax=Streptomyces subrutilus TaxID=36818 RepID=A0A1E5PRQ8_9ACTN|nr:cation:proton antiporter [Streptomyces subrutilus]OEJ32229.1 sodium:proton exchanger [Streptomyces subrutilus]